MIWIDKGSYVFLSFADTFYIVKNSLKHKKKELHFHPALIRVHQEMNYILHFTFNQLAYLLL